MAATGRGAAGNMNLPQMPGIGTGPEKQAFQGRMVDKGRFLC